MMAGCKNVQTYIGANVFSGLSNTAYELTAQIYIAETTNIVSRAFWNVAADSFSSIVTLYSGAEIGGRFLEDLGVENGWRWGYGMWCSECGIACLPETARPPGADPSISVLTRSRCAGPLNPLRIPPRFMESPRRPNPRHRSAPPPQPFVRPGLS